MKNAYPVLFLLLVTCSYSQQHQMQGECARLAVLADSISSFMQYVVMPLSASYSSDKPGDDDQIRVNKSVVKTLVAVGNSLGDHVAHFTRTANLYCLISGDNDAARNFMQSEVDHQKDEIDTWDIELTASESLTDDKTILSLCDELSTLMEQYRSSLLSIEKNL